MSYNLMGYQQQGKAGIYQAYRDGARNVSLVFPTGAGKTVVMGSVAHEYDGYGCSIAHRGELVGQLSVALAREGMQHDIIAPDSLIRTIVGVHMKEIGRSFYNQRARWKVASVNTLANRAADLPKSWVQQVGMVHGDEGHHYLADNIWGRAVSIFDNAYGLFPTATPERADGIGLGRAPVGRGIIDAMVEGPNMRWLIDQGFLTRYELHAPEVSDLDMSDVEVGSTGDYKQEKMRKRVKASTKIVGDVVDCYLEFARGLKGITFAVDVEHAEQIAAKFNARGVPAMVIHSKTPEVERREMMDRFKNGDLLQLVNVDLFGEGVDVPAVQVVSMARPTASYGLFVQQFGRALRLLVSPILRAAWHTYTPDQRKQFIAESVKPRAIIIDHVGNVIKHNGPPDWRTDPWSLENRSSRKPSTDSIPMRACANRMCLAPFQRIYPSCPYCGWTPPEPADRSRPELVDGDVVLYTEELMQKLWGQKKKMDSDFCPIPEGLTSIAAAGIRNRHANNQAAQAALRQTMQLMMPPSLDERVANRRFFHTFGVDTLSAQSLPCGEAEKLRQRIIEKVTSK